MSMEEPPLEWDDEESDGSQAEEVNESDPKGKEKNKDGDDGGEEVSQWGMIS